MLRGHSTEKLDVITDGAVRLAKENPKVLERITSFELSWSTVDGVVVPSVRMQFKDPKEV